MIVGINAWSFPANLTVPQSLKVAKRAGFDSVELVVTEDGCITPKSTENDVLNYRRAADNMSLELRTLAVGTLWQYPLTSNDPEVSANGKETILKSLKIARWLGADTLQIIPGIVDPDICYNIAYERALKALKELAPEAEKLKVCIGIENVWNKFLLSPLEMMRFIDEVGSEWVGAYLDTGNTLINGYPQHWIRILGPRIKKIHVKDFRSAVGSMHGFVNILEGDTDWYSVRDALKDIGYDDVVTAEVPGYATLGDLGIRHAGEALRRLFKGG